MNGSLTIVVNMNSVIALLFGLVIQFSQVPSRLAGDNTAKSCAKSEQKMSCCAGLQSCPCAEQSDQKQKPAPLLPSAVDVKIVISKAPETNPFFASFSPPVDTAITTASAWEGHRAYAGVPLSVAFCSFVI